MKKTDRVIVIPDVHGRSFWRDAVGDNPESDVIFLGDYLDPYANEGITPEEAIDNFEDIISYAKENKDCQLLLGNHDVQYLCNFGAMSRIDYENSARIHYLFMDNLWLFRFVALRDIGGSIVLFSHAPILTEWIDAVGETTNLTLLANRMNAMLAKIGTAPWDIEEYIGQISFWRGGYDDFGSPIWADVREVTDNLIPTADYCVFGHTQQKKDPVITDEWACLDCRKAFEIEALLPSAISIKAL